MADGSLIFDTKIDPSGAKTGLASLDRLLKVGIGAIVAKQVADLGKIGLAYNSQIEDAEAAFSVLLGSTSKAKKHIKDLQEIALGTSFNTPQLANASKSFLAVGLSAEESKKQIEILGDISLGNTETFDYMALAMSQVAAKGRLMGQEAMQLRNAGLNPLELIAAQTGETMEELEARMSAGEISYEELTSAMEAATQEGGRFHNGLQVMKETFSGQVANITGSAKKLLGALTEPLFNWLSDIVLPKISAGLAFLNRNADATRAVVAMLGTAITVAFAIAKFNAIKGAIVSIGSAIKLFIVANPFLLVASAIAAVVVGLTMFIRSGGNVEDLMKKISKAIANFAKKLPGIFDSIAKELPGVIKSIAATVSKNLPEILKSGVTILTTILDGILQAIPKIIPVVIQVVTSFVSMLVANLPAIISAGIEILLALINGLLKALPKLIAMLPKIISAILGAIVENLPLIIDAGVQILLALINGLVEALPQLIKMLPTIITTVIDILVKNLPLIIDAGIKLLVALINGLIKAIPQLVKALPKIISAIVNGLIQLAGALISAGVSLISRLLTGIKNGAVSVWNYAKSIPGKIAQWIKSGLSAIFNVGRSIVSGLWDGIKSGWGWLKGKIKGFGSDVVGGFKSFFKINSPSLLMSKIIGSGIVEGIGHGIIKKTSWLLAKARDQLASMRDVYVEEAGTMRTYFDGLTPAVPIGGQGWASVTGCPSDAPVQYVDETINIYQPVHTPAETAKAIRNQRLFGLAGA